MKLTNVICLSGAAVTVLTSCVQNKQESSKAKPMNVIYILADDLGFGDVGYNGQKLIKTPNIDRMAKEGMIFTQYYAGCTVSAPSRCSLLTGMHTGHAQIRGNQEIDPEGQFPMHEKTFTLGEMFKEHGYSTGIFGKWGLGYPGSVSTPNKLGFDEAYGYNCQRESHDYYPEHLWHNGKKVEFPENKKHGRKTYSHDLIHQQALQFIRGNKDKPFFALLTYTLPHAEINLPHDSIYKKYQAMFNEKGLTKKPVHFTGYYPSNRPHTSFAAMVSRLDKGVGEVLAELKKLGLDKNTLVIFTSDNGPHAEGGADPRFFNSNAQFRGIKRDLYEGGIREPMIAWAPNMVKGGSKTDLLSAFWDVMPTLGDLVGASYPDSIDGISFLPTLEGKSNQKKHDYLYWEFHGGTDKQAIRKGDWKLIRLGMGGHKGIWEELYNIKDDESETKNLYKSNPKKVKELKALMDSAHVESPNFKLRK